VKQIIAILLFGLAIVPARVLADDPMAVGKAALQKGDLQTAIVSFREAVRKDKQNVEGFILLGTALLRADSLDQAVAALVQARELAPANPAVYDMMGDAYAEQNIFAGAIEQYKHATDLDSTNIGYLLKLADANRRQRQYREAARAYLRVMGLDSGNVPASSELAKIYFRAKQWLNALPYYERLYRLQPESLNVAINFVRVLAETKRYKDLIPVAERVLKADASQSEVETMLAEAYSATGALGPAVDAYRNKNPDSLSINDLIRFAKALKALGQADSSADIYERALKKDSTRCDIFYDMGTLYMKVQRYEDAVRLFEKKIACDTMAGYQFACHLNIAMSLMQVKNFKEAKVHIKKAIEFRPDNIQAWQALAQDEAQLNEANEEREAYMKVVELATAANANGEEGKYNKQLEEAYRMVGFQYLSDKKWLQAAETLKKALQFNQRDCQMLLWIGQAYHNAKNTAEAKKYYCKVLEMCPKAKEAKDAETGLKLMGEDCGKQ
jgi:tetratricopeptide (TPR) repeat protein